MLWPDLHAFLDKLCQGKVTALVKIHVDGGLPRHKTRFVDVLPELFDMQFVSINLL